MTKQEAQREFDFAAHCYNRALHSEAAFIKLGEWNNAQIETDRKSDAMGEMWRLLSAYPDLDQSQVK
jgi:hypothetical protein